MKEAIIAIGCILAIATVGCTSDKMQVIHNENVVTNTVSAGAFNDESYIWENWSHSTNEVKYIYSK